TRILTGWAGIARRGERPWGYGGKFVPVWRMPPPNLAVMDNVDLSVLKQVVAWCEAGHRAVLGTVTRTWGSAPRPVGSVVAVRGDGLITGSVSGGCIEDDLIAKVREGALALHKPEVVRYGVDAEA